MMTSGDRFPAYIAGVVVSSADVVRVVFTDGQTRDFPTFEAPAPVGRVRFFAGRLGTATSNSWHPGPQKLVGLDASGNVVACHDKTKAASSTLADCR